jgi:hypothetical protein
MHTAIVCQRTRMRGSTAPLRQDFVRCIEPDTGERQAKSQGERGAGSQGDRDQGTGIRVRKCQPNSRQGTPMTRISRVFRVS